MLHVFKLVIEIHCTKLYVGKNAIVRKHNIHINLLIQRFSMKCSVFGLEQMNQYVIPKCLICYSLNLCNCKCNISVSYI